MKKTLLICFVISMLTNSCKKDIKENEKKQESVSAVQNISGIENGDITVNENYGFLVFQEGMFLQNFRIKF